MYEAIILVGAVGAILTPLLFYYLLAVVIWALASFNVLFTYAREGTAKPIFYNDRFIRFILAFAGQDFIPRSAGSTDPADDWNVGPSDTPQRSGYIRLPLLRNIVWIGLPPMGSVPLNRFRWSSLEETQGPAGVLTRLPITKEKMLDYVLLQEDVYVFRLAAVECSDNIPLDSVIIVGGRVINPYKALYRVQQWLESTENVIGAKMRDFFGPRSYEQLRRLAQPEEARMPGELFSFFQETIVDIEKDWGFKISFVRIFSVDPGSDLARQFIQASTQRYVAEQQRDARKAEGEGLASRDQQHFAAIAGIAGGPQMFKWTKIAESKLTTYVDQGAGALPTVPVGSPSPTSSPSPAGTPTGTPTLPV